MHENAISPGLAPFFAVRPPAICLSYNIYLTIKSTKDRYV